MLEIKDLIVENTQLLAGYDYVYMSSTGLFLLLKNYKGTPRDFDIALNWQGKGKKELLELYDRIRENKHVSNIGFQIIENQKTVKYDVQKNQNILFSHICFEELLLQGNIKLTYLYKGMPVELFPEQDGNGLINMDVCNPKICKFIINNTEINVLDTLEIARRYVVNFIDEVNQKHLYDVCDPDYKHKDALRLNTIIQILYDNKMDCSPQGVVDFIKKTMKELKYHMSKTKRSIFMQNILAATPKIKNKLLYIAKLYKKFDQDNDMGKKNITFPDFHKELKTEMIKVCEIIQLYQNNLVQNIGNQDKNFLDKIQKSLCKKIEEYLMTINLTNKINGFAYFYEFYSITHMFKKKEKLVC